MDAVLVHGFGKSGSSKLELSNLGGMIRCPNLSRAFCCLGDSGGTRGSVSIAVRYSEGIRAVRFGCAERLLSAECESATLRIQPRRWRMCGVIERRSGETKDAPV